MPSSDDDEQPVPEQIREAIVASDYPELGIRELMRETGLSKDQIVAAAGSMDRLVLDRSVGAVRLPEDDGGEFVDDHEEQLRTDGGEDRPESPYDDAELVIYTTDAGDAEAEPRTEWGQALDLISFSLWARYEDGSEVPIYSRSETGVWLSLDSQEYHPDPADPVSDAFVQSVVNMTDEAVGEGWGDPTEAAFEAMADVEKQIWAATRWAFLEMESPEAAAVIDWCQKHRETGGEDGAE